MNVTLNLKPEVRGVAIVTRKGQVVGKVPLQAASKAIARVQDAAGEKDDSLSAQPATEDPF